MMVDAAPQPDIEQDEPFVEPKGYDPSLGERASANFAESLGGSLAGSLRTGAQAIGKATGTGEDRDFAKANLQERAIEKALYDTMSWSNSPLEFGSAFAGQVGGAMLSPESYINVLPGLGRFAGTVAGRIGSFGASQGVVNAGQDAVQQAVEINAGLRKDYSLAETALSFGLGTALGTSFGGVGEVFARYMRYRRAGPDKAAPVEAPKQDIEIAREDLSRAAADDPSLRGIETEAPPRPEPEAVAPVEPIAAPRAPEPAPAEAAKETLGPYERAKEFVQTQTEIGTSRLQREFKLPYQDAHNMLVRMEQDGVVGAANDHGRRSVLQPGITNEVKPEAPRPYLPTAEIVPAMPAHRVSTAEGRSIEVRPVVIEAADLKTSADAGYDAALQPRNRDRAASQAQIRDIATRLDPERLGVSAEADRGAPIVGPDGMVESGNGRVMAIRQVYAQGGEVAQRYRDWLTGQGVDLSKYREPILVRERMTPLGPQERQKFTVEANQAATLAMSAPERAMADARAVSPDLLDLLKNPNDLGAVGNRDFVRAFVGQLPQAEQGALVAADGTLSAEGLARVRNAVIARAYGDASILSRIAEATSDDIKSISNALVAAAPDWAKLRADVQAGLVRADMDMTDELIEAVKRTADIRSRGSKLAEFLAQQDAFDVLDKTVEAWMRAFYNDTGTRAAGAQIMADRLRVYAQRARAVTDDALDLGLPPVDRADAQRLAIEKGSDGLDTSQAGLQFSKRPRVRADGATDGGDGQGLRRGGPEAGGQDQGAASAGQAKGSLRRIVAGPDAPAAVREWKAAAPFETLDEVYKVAGANQARLGEVARAVGAELGLEFSDPGIKGQARSAEKLAEKGGRAGNLTDIVRGGYVLREPGEADRVVGGLAKHFELIDEGWVTTKDGYVDRKILVRFEDGMVGEIQLWEPNLLDAKERGGGHALYEEARRLPPDSPKQAELVAKMKALYGEALAAADPSWREVVEGRGRSGSSPNRRVNSSSETSPAVTPMAARDAGFQAPSTKMNAASSEMRTGVPSQSAKSNSDMGGSIDGDLQFRKRTAGSPAQPGQQGAGAASGPPPEVLSLQQQSMRLAEVLDLPTYQGRVQGGQTSVGQFDTRQGVVRVRQIADFPTVAHEAAHAMEQRIGQPLKDLIQRHGGELGPLDNTGKMDPREGFAIWAENWITNPATGPVSAPQFSAAFERTMRAEAPDAWKALTDAQASHLAWVNSSPGEKVGAIVKTETPDTALKTLKEEGVVRSVSLVLGKAYSGLFDDKSVVTKAVRDLSRMAREASGARMNLEGADNPENLVRLFSRNAQSAIRDMLDGVRGYRAVDPSTPGLRDAIIMGTGQQGKLGFWDTDKVKDVSDYLVLRRAAVLYDKFDRGELPNRPLAMTKGDVLAGLAEMEQANPNLAAAAQMVHDYTRGLLKKMYDGGLIDADLFGKLMQEDFYVPLYRDMSDKPKAGGAATSSPDGPGMTQLVKRMKGSDRDIIDPIQSLMMQTFLVNRTVQHNDIIRSFVDLARKAQSLGATGTGRVLEEIPAHQLVGQRFDLQEVLKAAAKKNGIDEMDTNVLASAVADVFGEDPILGTVFRAEPAGKKGEPIVFYKDGGQLKAVRMVAGEEGMALYEALSQLPPVAQDWALAVGQASATALRSGIVTNPVFAVTNFIRDQVAAGILRSNYVPFDPRGVKSELKQDRWAELYTYAGGVSPGAGAQGLHDAVNRSIDALARKGWAVQKLGGLSDLVRGQGMQRITGPAKAIGEVVETAEAGTRLNVMRTVFEQKKAQGLSDYDAMIEAAAQATDLMDFGRHGSGTLYIRTLVPFLNAHLQGIDKAWRTLGTPVYRALKGDVLTKQDEAALKNAGLAWFKMAGVGGALGYMYSLWAQNHRAYQDANEELRATHLIIPGSAFGMDGKILVIPKPFELAVGFNLGEMAGLKVGAGDPRWAEFARAGVMEVIAPPNVLTSIPIVKTYSELKLNRSFFTGRDIVPERLQALKPEEQFTEKTSALARTIGNAIGVSPVKVDYAIGSTFGLYGRDLLSLSNTADPNAPAASLYDQMFLRRFIKNADGSSETTKRFWDQAGQRNGQLAKAKATYESMLGQFRDADAMRFLAALPKQERTFAILSSAVNEDGKKTFTTDERRMHPLVRAAEAATALNGMVRELSRDAQVAYEDGSRIGMDPAKRRDVIEQLRVLSAMEQHNALVMVGDKGYAGRPLEDTAKQLEVIRAHAPRAADEVTTRYATAKIYPGKALAAAWPTIEKRLLADGGQADIRDLAADVTSEGYEFGGERVKRPAKRRIEIRPQALTPALQ